MARVSFGNRRAGILAHLKQRQRLDLIADGLPIIAASAHGFWDASQKLESRSREATVLEGFAEEEAAKAWSWSTWSDARQNRSHGAPERWSKPSTTISAD